MAALHVERLGGLAGFGAGRSRIRSVGQIDSGALPPAVQQVVERLFQTGEGVAAHAQRRSKTLVRDGFYYRLSRTTEAGLQTVEVPEAAMPTELVACVRDELL